MGQAKPIPEGMHSIIPQLVFEDAAKAIAFYVRAFDAQEMSRVAGPRGTIMHAAIRIGDSAVFLSDELPGAGTRAPSPDAPAAGSIMLYVPDVDATLQRAVDAGAKVTMPVMDAFWGDRAGMLVDPFGYAWFVATHVRDVSEEELRRGAEQMARQMEAAGAPGHA